MKVFFIVSIILCFSIVGAQAFFGTSEFDTTAFGVGAFGGGPFGSGQSIPPPTLDNNVLFVDGNNLTFIDGNNVAFYN